MSHALSQALRPELLLQRQTGDIAQLTPAQLALLTRATTPSSVVSGTASSSVVTATASSPGAPLMARLVGANNQMVSVSNLLAAQRAQGPRTTATIKLQGICKMCPSGLA